MHHFVTLGWTLRALLVPRAGHTETSLVPLPDAAPMALVAGQHPPPWHRA